MAQEPRLSGREAFALGVEPLEAAKRVPLRIKDMAGSRRGVAAQFKHRSFHVQTSASAELQIINQPNSV